MKRILVLGAGQSSPSLIRYLLDNADEHDWFVTVGDLDESAAAARIDGHSRGTAIRFNVNDPEMVEAQVSQADIVVNFLAPPFQPFVARECVRREVHMVSASYRSREILELNETAQRNGVLILNEMGLDPGIDLMSAMEIIQRVRDKGGRILKFVSYGSGLPAPDSVDNPMKYVITWNPANVVGSGRNGAQYLEDGKIKMLPYHHVFKQTWPVEVDGIGTLEAYPNRDSLAYKEHFGLPYVDTMIRGTLRYPGYCETWSQMVNLGVTNEILTIPELANRSAAELVEMCLPQHANGSELRQRVANYLGINPTGHTMDQLEWLGLFDTDKPGYKGATIADAMKHHLVERMPLRADKRDMVILVHKMLVEYEGGKREKIISTFVHYGTPGGHTAMSQTVGIPAAIATKLILTNKIPLTGCQIPLHAAVYKPVMKELEGLGMSFTERTEEEESLQK
ncbi:saccharopine dehydrogenase NADP-binding domain-containing protein [bacterium]|nr:saccharopine dehydrogenase NADP-binding domain-containing protein [bacterium]